MPGDGVAGGGGRLRRAADPAAGGHGGRGRAAARPARARPCPRRRRRRAGLRRRRLPALFELFDRTPGLADLGAAALAHVACAALGIGLGLLVAPPAARRPNAAFVVIVVYAVLAVPLYDLAPVLSPVAWLAASLTDAAPHTLGAAVVLGALVALVQSALALVAGEALRRRAG
jgi:hypothetical protein